MRLASLARLTFFLTFIALFIYFYSTSGKFRKSITAALIAAFVFFASPEHSASREVEAFPNKPQQQSRLLKPKGLFGSPSQNSGPEKPDNPSGNGKDFDLTPEYHGPESVAETETRLDTIDGYLGELDSQTDSDSESDSESSCDVMPTQTQVSKFVNDGEIDLNQAFSEVNRRASMIGCETFDCSFDRFKELATECGEIKESSVREAITILQGEMEGHYKNARREDYGLNVKGPDFRVEGLGKFKSITHVEAKNPVGSAIKIMNGQKGSIAKQGKKIGAKLVYQQNYWSNPDKTSTLENLNPTASLPKSPDNILGVIDNFDLPFSEKSFMKKSILKGSQNDINIIFLNNN